MNKHIHKFPFFDNRLANYLKRTKLWETWPVKSLRDARLKRRLKHVSLDHLLCGGEYGVPAARYAYYTANLLRPSTPFYKSPHVSFLKRYVKIGDGIFRPDIFKQTPYYENASECISIFGHYFGYKSPDQIEHIARNFVSDFLNGSKSKDTLNHNFCFSPTGSPVRLRPIKFSDYYEIIDGNHRLAISLVRGKKTCLALIHPESAITPLQELLLDQIWLRGKLQLYQPISSPEIQKEWLLVRRCTDRFQLVKSFLRKNNLLPPACTSFLDIACSYGWFIQAFNHLGFFTKGVEIDPAAVEIGRLVYGLKSDQITRSEVVNYLKNDKERYDIILAFSLLHHFVLNRGSISAEQMLALIDSKTNMVFFFDMGQSHEEWFRKSLAKWDSYYIEQWVRNNSSFKRIYRLGKDTDNRHPFEDNYGRTLFACMR